MSESDPHKRLLQLTQAIEQNIENKKREPSSIVVRVLFSRLTHYEDRKANVSRLMCITGSSALKLHVPTIKNQREDVVDTWLTGDACSSARAWLFRRRTIFQETWANIMF
jgi:hypothetical protein